MAAEERTVDVVVLGTGSGGGYVANQLADAGRSVIAVEAGRVGGECPFVACMPAKALLHEAAMRRDAPHDSHDWAEAVAFRDEIASHRDDSGKARDMAGHGVEVIRGWGRLAGPRQVEIEAADGRRLTVHATTVVVASGSTPIIPPIDGIDDVPTWTSDQALSSAELPGRLLVLGGGAVGCESAQFFAAYDTQVLLVDTTPHALGREDPEIGAVMDDVLRASGVELHLESEVVRFEPDGAGLRAQLADGTELTADRVLLGTGRRPTVADIGLASVGLPEDEPVAVDARGRVGDDGWLYAVGDVTGEATYTHTANAFARSVVDDLLGRTPTEVDLDAMPRAVFTVPPFAAVGLTAAAAREAGHHVVTEIGEISDTARSASDDIEKNGAPAGRIVLHADADTGLLLGAALLAPHADSLVGEASLALHAGVPIRTWVDVVHPFPSFGEGYEMPLRALANRLGPPRTC